MRHKMPDLVRALDGQFGQHHAVQLRGMLDHIDTLDTSIDRLNDRIATMAAPWGGLSDQAGVPKGENGNPVQALTDQ